MCGSTHADPATISHRSAVVWLERSMRRSGFLFGEVYRGHKKRLHYVPSLPTIGAQFFRPFPLKFDFTITLLALENMLYDKVIYQRNTSIQYTTLAVFRLPISDSKLAGDTPYKGDRITYCISEAC